MRLAGRAPPPRPFIATPPACCRRVCADYPQGPRSGTADARRADVVVSDRQARAHGDTHPEIRVGPPTARLPARRPQAQTRPTQTQVRRVQTTAQSWCSASSATSRSHNASYGPHTFRYPDHRAHRHPPRPATGCCGGDAAQARRGTFLRWSCESSGTLWRGCCGVTARMTSPTVRRR